MTADAVTRPNHAFRPEVFDGPAVVTEPTAQPGPVVEHAVDATATEEDEAVAVAGGAVERSFAISPKPDRDGAGGLRNESGSVDPVEATLEVNDWLGEESAQ